MVFPFDGDDIRNEFRRAEREYSSRSVMPSYPWPDPDETRWNDLKDWLRDHPEATADDVLRHMKSL